MADEGKTRCDSDYFQEATRRRHGHGASSWLRNEVLAHTKYQLLGVVWIPDYVGGTDQ